MDLFLVLAKSGGIIVLSFVTFSLLQAGRVDIQQAVRACGLVQGADGRSADEAGRRGDYVE